MTKIDAAKFRANFSEVTGHVAYRKDRVVITKHGKRYMAIVPVEDLDLLEALEDVTDAREYKRVKAEIEAGRDKLIPWADATKALDQKRAVKRKPAAKKK